MGAMLTEAAMRSDLEQVAADHALTTGVDNPNSYAPNRLRVGEQVVPEDSEHVYRQINAEGLGDLALSGVVRGAFTAGARSKTNGHTTYWTQGETGKGSTLGQGFVIEAPLDAAESGWVTADKVAVYARDDDNTVKNIVGRPISG